MTDVQHTIRPGKGVHQEDRTPSPVATGTPTRRRRPRRFVVVAVLAVLAVLVGVVGPWAYSALAGSSPRSRIAADPPPALFPGPPPAAARAAELHPVQELAVTRTAAGVAAATWLETFGKKDIWRLYAHDQAELVPSATGEARKQQLKDMLSMSKTVADALGTRYQQSAPYVLDPTLRTDHAVTRGQVCPCSYPSRHATASAAARTYLSAYAPHMDAQYRWMQDEVAYSRVYMAGHVPSDIEGGTLLGDMIADYFLVTRGHHSPS